MEIHWDCIPIFNMTSIELIDCGMKIRADDPLAMKIFIQSVQNRVNELKASSGAGQAFINNKRVSFCHEKFSETYLFINSRNVYQVILADGLHA